MSGDHGGTGARDMNVARSDDGRNWVDTEPGGGSANDDLLYSESRYMPRSTASGELLARSPGWKRIPSHRVRESDHMLRVISWEANLQ
jgi:hypothetical protein